MARAAVAAHSTAMRSLDLRFWPPLKSATFVAWLTVLSACTTQPRLAPPDASREVPREVPRHEARPPAQGVLIMEDERPPAVVNRPPPPPGPVTVPRVDPGPQVRSPAVAVNARPLVRPPPDYPAALRDQDIEGRVVASISVAASGQVESVVIRSATHPLFEQAVRSALKRWRFEPARSASGQALPDRVQVPFQFRVE